MVRRLVLFSQKSYVVYVIAVVTNNAGRLAYMEFCAPENICADSNCSHAIDAEGCALDDIEYVRMANPALGRRISIQYIRDERQALAATPREYARERLGWWDEPDASDQPHIQMETWLELTDPTVGTRRYRGVRCLREHQSDSIGHRGGG